MSPNSGGVGHSARQSARAMRAALVIDQAEPRREKQRCQSRSAKVESAENSLAQERNGGMSATELLRRVFPAKNKKGPSIRMSPFGLAPGDDLLSHGETPHYHRR